MVKSMYAAIAGLRAHQTKMDVIGNNIANVNTNGYKSARAVFSDVYYATTSGASSSGDTYGGTNPSQIGYGSQISSISSNMSAGGGDATDNPYDVMIEKNGYFLVGTKLQGDSTGIELETETSGTKVAGEAITDGALSGLYLTRVGQFQWDEDGYLVDSNGMCVYGFDPSDDTTTDGADYDTGTLVPIRLDNALEDDSTYKAKSYNSISIGTNGEITGTTTDDEGNETVTNIGQIALGNVTNENALERQSNGYYLAKNNTGTLTANVSGENGTSAMKSGYLESSNVDLSKEFTEMITCQRGFQANTRIITVTDTMLEELVNLKR